MDRILRKTIKCGSVNQTRHYGEDDIEEQEKEQEASDEMKEDVKMR